MRLAARTPLAVSAAASDSVSLRLLWHWNKAYDSRVTRNLCACYTDRPHLPFVAPASKFALYPPSEIKLPADQQPPTGMPRIAWSNSGELFGYNWTATLDPEKYHGLQPGQVLPPEVVLDLRRAYYSAVSHVSAPLFLASLEVNV